MLENFPTWWDSLALLEKIYWGLAIPFTLFFILQLIVTFFGGEVVDDSSADADIEGDDGIGFQFLTLKNLIAFFTIFSWTGIACLDSGMSSGLTIFVSFIAGLIMMSIMASLFYFMSKATESGTMDINRAKGGVGEVYLTVKAQRGNIGQVQIKVQGSLRTLEAITDDHLDLPTGTVISVTDVINDNILLISKN